MLIDLDVTPHAAPARRRRRMRPALLVGLLLALLLQSAVRPAPVVTLSPVADTGEVTFSVVGADAVYVIRQSRQVEAIPLAAGGPHWSVRVGGEQPPTSLSLAGSTLVVNPTTSFLDARTGRERWRTAGPAMVRVLGDLAAYADWGGTLWLVDLATGHPHWRRPGTTRAVDGDEAHRYLIGVEDDGRATVYSAVDGSVLAAGRGLGIDPFSWATGTPVGAITAAILGDTVYTYGQTSVAAYRLPRLTPLWRLPKTETSQIGPCGALICIAGEQGSAGLDPATGAARWSNPRWRAILPDGLAVGGDQRPARIDPATGQVLQELGRGSLAGDLLLRYDRDRTYVVRLSGDRILGVIPVIALSGCTAAGYYLACPMTGQATSVWKIR